MSAVPPARRGAPDRSTHDQRGASSLSGCHTLFIQTTSAETALGQEVIGPLGHLGQRTASQCGTDARPFSVTSLGLCRTVAADIGRAATRAALMNTIGVMAPLPKLIVRRRAGSYCCRAASTPATLATIGGSGRAASAWPVPLCWLHTSQASMNIC